MIYLLLFWEFFKIGLLAVGGGLVTIPFLYDLSEKYSWFTTQELMDMIAVSESTPGPIGVNMATYAGFQTMGVGGGIVATLGLLLPSLIIIICLAYYLKKYSNNLKFETVLRNIRPIALALIAYGGFFVARSVVINWQIGCVTLIVWGVIHYFRWHPIVCIALGALGGMFLA